MKEKESDEGEKGWAGWVPKSEEEKLKFKKQVLCPESSRAWVDCGHEGRVGFLAGKVGIGGGGQGNNDGDKEQEQVQGS